ncbi:MAG: hypothetical protein ABI748_06175 [Dokdonella sp.]
MVKGLVPATPDVLGADLLIQKRSAVTGTGELRAKSIAGLVFRPTRPVAHEDGYLTEVAKTAWHEWGDPIVQVHITTTLPDHIRAWGLHQCSTDRLFVVTGLVEIVAFDGRDGSPTRGVVNRFIVSDHNPALIVVPPCVYHGWHNIGTIEAVIINMPTSAYDYETPDALDLPWDSDEAHRTIPHRFQLRTR